MIMAVRSLVWMMEEADTISIHRFTKSAKIGVSKLRIRAFAAVYVTVPGCRYSTGNKPLSFSSCMWAVPSLSCRYYPFPTVSFRGNVPLHTDGRQLSFNLVKA